MLDSFNINMYVVVTTLLTMNNIVSEEPKPIKCLFCHNLFIPTKKWGLRRHCSHNCYQNHRLSKKATAGICRACKNRATVNSAYCEFHLKKNRERRKNWRAKGLCGACGRKTQNGLSVCEHHNQCAKAGVEARKNSGICIKCCRNEALPARRMCEKCVRANKKWKAQRREKFKANGVCSDCGRERHSAFKICDECRSRRSINHKKETRQRRERVISAYGGKCEICSESRYELLAIDHKNGDGAAERKKMTSEQMVMRIIKNGFPEKYRILCHNCNQRARTPLKPDNQITDSTRKSRVLKREVLCHYGGTPPTCSCCGTDEYGILTLNHLKRGTGRKHNREVGGATMSVYVWAKKNNYPPMFDVRCFGCNFADGKYGRCPCRDIALEPLSSLYDDPICKGKHSDLQARPIKNAENCVLRCAGSN